MNALAAIDVLFVPSRADWLGSLPEIVLTLGLAATLVVPLFGGRTRAAAGLTMLASFVAALLVTIANFDRPDLRGSHFGEHMLVIDGVANCWRVLLLLSSVGVTLLWLRSEEHRIGDAPEFSALLVGATLGMSLLAQAGNLLMLLIALELTSMPSYVLAGFRKADRGGAEASIKYVLFGAAATATMIFCSTYLYGLFGTLDFAAMAERFRDHGVGSMPLLCIALVGLLIGLAFKLAAVPLHLWCPDTFQGASVEVAVLLSIASKGAALVQLGRLMHWIDLATPIAQFAHTRNGVAAIIAGLAVLTMTLGNFAALGQTNLKRLLAYSSIAQAGYMLAGIAAMLVNDGALPAVLAYLAVYLCMNLGAFAVAAAVQRSDGHASIDELAGLSATHPLLAAAMSLCMFSFVGLPPLGGFSVKLNLMFLLITAGGWWWIVVAAIGVNSAISLYYYARVVRAMYLQTGTGQAKTSTVTTTLAAICGMALLLSFFLFGRLGSAMKTGGQFETSSAQVADAR